MSEHRSPLYWPLLDLWVLSRYHPGLAAQLSVEILISLEIAVFDMSACMSPACRHEHIQYRVCVMHLTFNLFSDYVCLWIYFAAGFVCDMYSRTTILKLHVHFHKYLVEGW